MMVTLVDSMHQQEFCSLLRGPFHLTRPLCTWNLCVGPERFDCRHEAAVLHFLLRIVAVPASIVELMLRHPINRFLHPTVFSVPENEQGPDHVASRQGSSQRLPFFPGCPRSQRFTSTGLGHVKAPLSSWCRSRNFSHARLTPSSGVNPISPRSIKGQTVDVHLGE